MSSVRQFTIELFVGAAVRVVTLCVGLVQVILLRVWAIFVIIVFVIQLLLQREWAVLNVAVGFG